MNYLILKTLLENKVIHTICNLKNKNSSKNFQKL